jgi:Peptidase A4 family
MKTDIILTTICCISAVLAAPSTKNRRQSRAARTRRSSPFQNVTEAVTAGGHASNSDVSYSNNWAGAVLVGSGFTSVTGTVVVPQPQSPPGGDGVTEYSAAAWVGIDGDTCESAILQTGVDFNIQGGVPSYDAWFEWYPAVSYSFDGFSFGAGDSIEITVTASSTTSGVATLTNLGTGQSVSHTFENQDAALCLTNAEWIVEDASNGYSLIPFADFTTVTFTGASAVTGGSTVDTSGATIADIRQNDQVLTSCSADGSEVSCTYV